MSAMAPDVSTFQGLILALQQFWAERGCVILQPLDMEVGAGTFHPATFLRAIGPETWNSAYVQPCRRPTDGRYGENPNRLQHYYQFQVVLKPSPEDIQEQYLDSLRYLGIDPLVHDIRFVEDNWESPTLGAWGLGWEVWLNGMEVTQFTYFQQVGGLECYPVTGEITYGLERIAMYLQGVDSIYDLVWTVYPSGKKVTYGDVFHQNEVEMSRYNFEEADVSPASSPAGGREWSALPASKPSIKTAWRWAKPCCWPCFPSSTRFCRSPFRRCCCSCSSPDSGRLRRPGSSPAARNASAQGARPRRRSFRS